MKRLEFVLIHADNERMETKFASKSSMLGRVLVTVGCVAAFAVMASIFSPDRSRAGDILDPHRVIPPTSVEYPPQQSHQPHTTPPSVNSTQSQSADPHEGLRSLGVIENRGYTIHIYATEGGPRYTVYENATGAECGALLTEAQVHQAFPDLQLPTMEFDAGQPLMLADPPNDLWW